MEQEKKQQNEEFTTSQGRGAEGAADNEQGNEQRPEGSKNKGTEENTGSHDEGQYQEGKDKPTMSPGSSQAKVNPSANKDLGDNDQI